jgi:DNA polymerase III delta prime subunit
MSRESSIYHDLQHLQEPCDPSTIEELCFPSLHVETELRRWTARSSYAKNLLFHGPPGSGKTRAAYVLCQARLSGRSNEWYPVEYIECESGTFDVVFQQLKSAYTAFQRLDDADFEQFVILDEVDNFKGDQQRQLKKLLERRDLAFLLITNYVAKIDWGIRNRCLEIAWHLPAPEACLPRLRQVASGLGAGDLSDAVLVDRVYTCSGWRQMLRNLDALSSTPVRSET